jgi:hypothetical protein
MVTFKHAYRQFDQSLCNTHSRAARALSPAGLHVVSVTPHLYNLEAPVSMHQDILTEETNKSYFPTRYL